MTTRVDTEDISSTKSEKFLAVVLTIFILIGAGWAYYKIGEVTHPDQNYGYTASEQRAIDAQVTADLELDDATTARDDAKTQLDVARSDLDLAAEQDRDTTELEQAYREAQGEYKAAQDAYTDAAAEAKQADAAARAADQSYSERVENDQTDWRDAVSAGLRLVLVGALTFGGFGLIRRLRERDSRYLPLGFAVAAAGVIMALTFAIDYIGDYLDLLDLGPIVLSTLGIAATIGAFIALQRYLARRIPRSRVRKGECPFCGFPVHDRGPHCEGCGREVVAACGACSSPRRVGSPHCPTCGD